MTVKRNIKVPLTDEEIVKYAKEAADKSLAATNKKEELKSFSKQRKGEIEEIETEIHNLQWKVNSGEEWRQVECTEERDIEKKVKVYKRVDTGEYVDSEPMTDYELQLTIEDEIKKKEEEEKKNEAPEEPAPEEKKKNKSKKD